jgi:hypothetical protein
MNKIFLAFAILGVGTAGFVTARHATINLQREVSAIRESWPVQTQVLADAQSELARLAERIRALKQNLSLTEAAGRRNDVWSVLENNRIGNLSPDLREHLFEELRFNWNSSEAFIVVSKETVHEMKMHAMNGWWPFGDDWHARLTDSAAAVLALTPQERSRVEAAMERVKEDLKDWAVSHTERSEPRGDIVAQYTLQNAPPTSITNKFMSEILSAIGKERTELMEMGSSDLPNGSIQRWLSSLSIWGEDKPTTMIVRRFSEGDREVLKAQVFTSFGTKHQTGDAAPKDIAPGRGPGPRFPKAFLPLFPNGWDDLAEREGFEIPKKQQKK